MISALRCSRSDWTPITPVTMSPPGAGHRFDEVLRAPDTAVATEFSRSNRSAVVVSLVVVAALVLAALLISSTSVGRTLFAPDETTTTTAVTPSIALSGARSFDPSGSGEPTENESSARNAIDGDILTKWQTEDYSTRSFGNLKIRGGTDRRTQWPTFHRSSPHLVSDHRLVGADPRRRRHRSDLARQLGCPIASARNIQGDVDLALDTVKATSVLVWITDLGDGAVPHVSITEVGLSGP